MCDVRLLKDLRPSLSWCRPSKPVHQRWCHRELWPGSAGHVLCGWQGANACWRRLQRGFVAKMVSSFWQKRDVGMWLFCISLRRKVIGGFWWINRVLLGHIVVLSCPTGSYLGQIVILSHFLSDSQGQIDCTSADPQTWISAGLWGCSVGETYGFRISDALLAREWYVGRDWNLAFAKSVTMAAWPRAKRFVWSGKCVTVCNRESILYRLN